MAIVIAIGSIKISLIAVVRTCQNKIYK